MKDNLIDRRDFLKQSFVLGSAAVLSGCSVNKQTYVSDSNTGGGTLTWRLATPKTIDPAYAIDDQSLQVIYQLFDSLLTYDYKQKNLVGCGADKWEVNSDNDEFIFHLNKLAVFHNNDPVTSQDFKRGYERICDSNISSSLAYHLNMIEGCDEFRNGDSDSISGITCPDDYTLSIKLTYSYPDFLYVVALPYLVPINKGFDSDKPIGNGAFKFDSYEDNKIVLTKFENYLEPAHVDKVEFINIENDEQAFSEFMAGNLCVCDVPQDKRDESIQEFGLSADGYTINPGKQCAFGEKPSCTYLVINCEDELLQDVDLRRAISLAINRQKICDDLFDGEVKPADNIVSPIINGYVSDSWIYSNYDVDAALGILDDKWPEEDGSRGLKLEISCDEGSGFEGLIDAIKTDLALVGIDVDVKYRSWKKHIQSLEDGDFQIARLSWNADMPIMDNFLHPLFYSTGSCNFSRYTEEDLDTKLDEARSISKESSRLTAFKDINKQLGEACPLVPLYYTKMSKVGSKAIKSAVINPDGRCKMSTVELNV